MRHKVSGRHFSRATDHRLAMYRNLVTDLLRYEKLVTTEAKAKEIKPMAEKMISLGKQGSLSARRAALAFVYDKKVVDKIFADYGLRYKERSGGYTRLVKLGNRVGDGASMAQIELV